MVNPPTVCFQGVPARQVFFAVHTNCVRTPEVTSLAGAGGLVRTYKTVAMFEVGVSMPFDLPGVRVPVATCSDPAKYRFLPTEVNDRPRITALATTAARLDNVTPAMVILEDLAASVRVQKRHLGGVLTRRSPNPTKGDRSVHVFPVPFKNTGRYRSGV